MKIVIRILFYSVVFVMVSCKKDATNYTINGVVYNNCELVPSNGLELELIYIYDRTFRNGIVQNLGVIKTDSEGRFKFSYSGLKNDGILELSIYDPISPTTILQQIPPFKNLNLTILREEVVNLEVVLSIGDSTYNEQDTLYYAVAEAVYGFQIYSIIGPFTNSVIDTLLLDLIDFGGRDYYFRNNYAMEGTLHWGVGYNQINNSYNSVQVKFQLTGCNITDKVYIELD